MAFVPVLEGAIESLVPLVEEAIPMIEDYLGLSGSADLEMDVLENLRNFDEATPISMRSWRTGDTTGGYSALSDLEQAELISNYSDLREADILADDLESMSLLDRPVVHRGVYERGVTAADQWTRDIPIEDSRFMPTYIGKVYAGLGAEELYARRYHPKISNPAIRIAVPDGSDSVQTPTEYNSPGTAPRRRPERYASLATMPTFEGHAPLRDTVPVWPSASRRNFIPVGGVGSSSSGRTSAVGMNHAGHVSCFV